MVMELRINIHLTWSWDDHGYMYIKLYFPLSQCGKFQGKTLLLLIFLAAILLQKLITFSSPPHNGLV
jgi:hypothetical protein